MHGRVTRVGDHATDELSRVHIERVARERCVRLGDVGAFVPWDSDRVGGEIYNVEATCNFININFTK